MVVLPQLPVTATTGTVKAAAPGLGQVAQGGEGVVDGDDRYFGASRTAAPLSRDSEGACPTHLCSTSTPSDAPVQGLGDEVVAVVALAGQGDEELPRLGGAGVGGDAAKGVPRTPLHQGAPGGGQDVVDGEGGSHQPWYSFKASGDFFPVVEMAALRAPNLVIFMALAGHQDGVAGPGQTHGQADGLPAVRRPPHNPWRPVWRPPRKFCSNPQPLAPAQSL